LNPIHSPNTCIACAAPQFSILIPTLNEAENIGLLLERLSDELASLSVPGEIIVVDGGSSDATRQIVGQWSSRGPVRLIASDAGLGLSGDILLAAQAAAGSVVLVMDADFSHPPESISDLLTPVLEDSQDLVIGSRYIPGGETPGWPAVRRFASRAATWLAWPLVSVRDPMSGFFAVKRDLLLQYGRQASGFKIGLEILVSGDDQLRCSEVPIIFRDRQRGVSKLGLRETTAYFKQIAGMLTGLSGIDLITRLAVVAGLLLVTDLLSALLLGGLTDSLLASQLSSLLLAGGAFHRLLRQPAGHGSGEQLLLPRACQPGWMPVFAWTVIGVLAFSTRMAVYANVSHLTGSGLWLPVVASSLCSVLVMTMGAVLAFRSSPADRPAGGLSWRIFALSVVGYMLVLRWLFADLIDLMPQESYYWLYAEHLDYGYLDHPPMVAWLIWASTRLIGQEELAVRLPALLCWCVTAVFIYRTTQQRSGKTAGLVAVMLVSILPVYAMMGMMTTPDSPLVACWAGCLYFLRRALLEQKSKAWLGAGLCLGLGLLSKYTIALLLPSTALFLLIDPRARSWILRREPYIALVVAALIFSPVIIWNANHYWASFNFQGSRRWTGESDFSLHTLLGAVFVLLSPIGVWWMIRILAGRVHSWQGNGQRSALEVSELLFARIFVLVPLAVFVLHSLRNNTHLNWTGPIWLAAIPLLSTSIVAQSERVRDWIHWTGLRSWRVATAILLVIYSGWFTYMGTESPKISISAGMGMPVAWEEMAAQVDAIQEEIGEEAMIVGMDRYKISSSMAFYHPDQEWLDWVSASHLFGQESVMWKYWEPTEHSLGKKVIMISFDQDDLLDPDLEKHFSYTGDVLVRTIEKDGRAFSRFYYRIGYGYRGDLANEEPADRMTASGQEAYGSEVNRPREIH
jgi:dolichol-phosphate mannosyltransferase